MATDNMTQAAEALRVISDTIHFLVTTLETNGTYALFETRTPPGTGTPPHRHRSESETFYVVDGTYTFLVGETTYIYGAGGVMHVPAGIVHAYTNTGQGTGRMLIVTAPGVAHERFFRLVGVPADSTPTSPPDIARVIAGAQECGIEILVARP